MKFFNYGVQIIVTIKTQITHNKKNIKKIYKPQSAQVLVQIYKQLVLKYKLKTIAK